MSKLYTMAALCAAAGLASCASSSALRLREGAAAPPPAGFVEFCARQPADCGVAIGSSAQVSTLRQHANQLYWRAAFAQARLARDNNDGRVAPSGRGSAFAGPDPAESLPESALDQNDWLAQTTPLVLSDQNWRLLQDVNVAVNRTVAPGDLRGSPMGGDYWSTPVNYRGVAYGDCKEYVIEKRRRLVAAGIPAALLTIAVASVEGENHAVLIISTDRGDYLLDSLTDEIRPWERAPYAWIERQSSSDPLNWARVEVEHVAGG